MTDVALATERSKRESPRSRSVARRATAGPMRGIWLNFRKLLAELAAFPVEIQKTNESLIFTIDVSGLEKEEVTVEVGDLGLIIDLDPRHLDRKPFPRAGRRLISLPEYAEIPLATAVLHDGFLIVRLPTNDRRRHRHLTVETVEESPVTIHAA